MNHIADFVIHHQTLRVEQVMARRPDMMQGTRYDWRANMPKVEFAGHTIHCEGDDNLRAVLLSARAPLYNGAAKYANCRGLGTCGTCAIQIDGSVTEPTTIEKCRLRVPPHRSDSGLRLACQCRVLGDLVITKHCGLWGTR